MKLPTSKPKFNVGDPVRVKGVRVDIRRGEVLDIKICYGGILSRMNGVWRKAEKTEWGYLVSGHGTYILERSLFPYQPPADPLASVHGAEIIALCDRLGREVVH